VLSLVAASLAIGTSLAGILVPGTYARETAAWALQAVGQDIANLPVAVLLVGSAAFIRRGSLRAVHVWLGCLLYFIYAFAIYAFAVHLNRFFLAYVAVLGLSFYSLVGTLATLDLAQAARPLRDSAHRKSAGALLITIGLLFGGLWLSELLPHLLAGTPPRGLAETGLWTNPVHVLDLAFVLPAMLLVGARLRRQDTWGLVLAVPLLVFAATMGIGILTLFGLSAAHGMPVAVPAAIVVAIVVILSAVHAWLLTRGPSRSP
jgi:hypothetical protein